MVGPCLRRYLPSICALASRSSAVYLNSVPPTSTIKQLLDVLYELAGEVECFKSLFLCDGLPVVVVGVHTRTKQLSEHVSHIL